jgi:amino acid adenylation domain-containing protein
MPGKTALICGETLWTYEMLEARANEMAHGLMALGIKRGDRVGIWLDNSAEAVIAVFGVLKADAVFMLMNPLTKPEKAAFILKNSQATVLVTSEERCTACQELVHDMPDLRAVVKVGKTPCTEMVEAMNVGTGLRHVSMSTLMASQSANRGCPPRRHGVDIDLASLVYTSGSTGSPKGVMLTHLNILTAMDAIITYLHLTEKDVILNVLPLSSVYGLGHLLLALKVGGTVVMERTFAYPHAVLQQMAATGVTGFGLVPMIAAMLLKMDLSKYDLSKLRYITNASAPMPTEHLQRLRTVLPGVEVYSMYGLTECLRVTYLEPSQLDRRPASVGRGMPNQELYLVDEDGNRVGPGKIGELVVRGAHVMKGYWDLPEETIRALHPGLLPHEMVLHTGDMFRMDEDGYLYFVSRKDDIIKSRGEKVSPKEIEDVLHGIEGIEEAAVIGVPDPMLGQAIKAIIVLKKGVMVTSEQVLRRCADRLETHMIPKLVEFHETLPKTDVGKIKKRELRIERFAS